MDPAQPVVDAVLFFDENMPKMEKCGKNCEASELVFCTHRFKFNPAIFYTDKSHVGFNDFEILMHCFNLIKTSQEFVELSKIGRFIIITKDHDFLEDAEKIWRKIKTGKPDFVFDLKGRAVSWDQCKILVQVIVHKKYGMNGHHDLRQMIQTLNGNLSNKQNP